MSAKAVREFHGKRLLARQVAELSGGAHRVPDRSVLVTADTDLDALPTEEPWLVAPGALLVVKPDQLIKRRGKLGLVGARLDWAGVRAWIDARMGTTLTVGRAEGTLDHFLVEPFVAHDPADEHYVCVRSDATGEEILFCAEGGVDVGDVETKAARLRAEVDEDLTVERVSESGLLEGAPERRRARLASFVEVLLRVFRANDFTYLEINPIVFSDDDESENGEGTIVPLDLAAKIDETAGFLHGSRWGHLDLPAPFGRREVPEEAFVRDLDGRTGASLKLTVLNPAGRIWTMVAGGGASVVYADTISDYGQGADLANYGEYSGAPSAEHTYQYARTILTLMTKTRDPRGKILLIGGGIANFTDVASTFTGLIRALEAFQDDLKTHKVDIWVRRAGPNYQEGLRLMRETSDKTGLNIRIYGPETHITAIVPLALGLAKVEDFPEFDDPRSVHPVVAGGGGGGGGGGDRRRTAAPSDNDRPSSDKKDSDLVAQDADHQTNHSVENFSASTRCVVYGLQQRAVQGMLDFDFMCKREKPSVAALIFPFSSNHYVKFYWGTSEILLPVFQTTKEAFEKHPDVTVVVNFASFRSVFSSVKETLEYSDRIRTVAIIAEGVPESQTRRLNKMARDRGVGIIGPASVGGIKPGCFRIGNTGGMLDNIVASKLYRPGSVAYVSKSGGMSNELNNIVSRNSDGVYEGVAVGGDRWPGSSFVDHLARYNDNPAVKILVLLGEVGGADEYDVCDALRDGRITKPLVAWCVGTCASVFPFEVQFGHAGALARGDAETARAKNEALKRAGAKVPDNFFLFGDEIRAVYDALVAKGALVPAPEPDPPRVPMDYTWAKRLGLVRKPANFVSSISDDRGEELKYGGAPISEVFENDVGVGGVLALLWFKRRLPDYASRFIEMVLMVTADHGPAVSGAHNTIVCTRAGKDLVSSLVSGLLTVGPRFGGALDDAAVAFAEAVDSGVDAEKFVRDTRKANRLVMGVGHKVKSLSNPDKRVEIVKAYAFKHFPNHAVLQFALAVEKVTTKKKANLILNVDGCIAACFVDMIRSCGAFSPDEANEIIRNGCLNGLFVLGRSIGFIGHHLDQKRLKQGLYRHPWDDISYLDDV